MTLPDCEIIAKYEDIDDTEWHRLRRTGIGGSDAGAIMGMSNYGSPLTVCLEKTGRVKPEDISDEEPIAVGNILEPIIRREMVAQYIKGKEGLDVEVIEPAHIYRSKENPFMIANTDGFLKVPFPGTEEGGLNYSIVTKYITAGLEIKTGSSYMLKYWGGKDGNEVPDSYYCQVQHYLAVTGLMWFYVFALIGNTRILRVVPRNEAFIADLIESERKLWEIIELNDPLYFPLPTGSDTEMEYIHKMGNPQVETTVDLYDMIEDVDRYLQLKVEIQDRQEERKRIKARLLLEMGLSKYGEAGPYKLAFSRFDRKNIDTRKMAIDYPDIVSEYTTFEESGRLSVKENK